MVNGSTGNPLKTSRRKTRDGIDRGENWRRIDCYPATDANLSTGLRGNSFTEDQPIPADSVSDYACTLQEVDVQRRQVRVGFELSRRLLL